MPKFLVASLAISLAVGCSSTSDAEVSSSEIEVLEARIEELEDLNSELAAENSQLKAASEPATTTTTEAPGPVYDDFSPTCTIDRIDSTGYVWAEISITNAFDERSTFNTTLDLFDSGNWVDSGSDYVTDVPAGRTGTSETFFYNYKDGRGRSLADFSCEVAEFDYR